MSKFENEQIGVQFINGVPINLKLSRFEPVREPKRLVSPAGGRIKEGGYRECSNSDSRILY